MERNKLIPAFAAKLGIGGLEAREGACSLEIDGIPLEIVETADGRALVASTIVGPPPGTAVLPHLYPSRSVRRNLPPPGG